MPEKKDKTILPARLVKRDSDAGSRYPALESEAQNYQDASISTIIPEQYDPDRYAVAGCHLGAGYTARRRIRQVQKGETGIRILLRRLIRTDGTTIRHATADPESDGARQRI